METAVVASQSKRSLVAGAGGVGGNSLRLCSPILNSVRLCRTFDTLDKNNDGMITLEEVRQALDMTNYDEVSIAIAMLGLDTDVSEIESKIQSHIQPGNAGLTYKDFEDLLDSLNEVFSGLDKGVDETSQDEVDLYEAFKVFDEDGDGYISARELQVVLGKLGLHEGKEIVEKMISSVDRNHDGRVDLSEFKDMMRSVMVQYS